MAKPRGRLITREELAVHVSDGDVWIAIHGRVYNVSKWTKSHPGGELVLMHMAGKDATAPFSAYHPAWVEKLLTKFYVGDLQLGHSRLTKASPGSC